MHLVVRRNPLQDKCLEPMRQFLRTSLRHGQNHTIAPGFHAYPLLRDTLKIQVAPQRTVDRCPQLMPFRTGKAVFQPSFRYIHFIAFDTRVKPISGGNPFGYEPIEPLRKLITKCTLSNHNHTLVPHIYDPIFLWHTSALEKDIKSGFKRIKNLKFFFTRKAILNRITRLIHFGTGKWFG